MTEMEHSKAHAESAKVGEEFERHLDRDLKELEAGQKLLKTLKLTHDIFKQNITAIIASEIRKSRIAMESLPNLDSESSAAVVAILDETEAKLAINLAVACMNLFNVQDTTVHALVHRLAEGAREAVDRREDLQGEIRHNIHEGLEEKSGEAQGDDWWKSEGNADNEEFESDDHWARETEKWHNQTGKEHREEAGECII